MPMHPSFARFAAMCLAILLPLACLAQTSPDKLKPAKMPLYGQTIVLDADAGAMARTAADELAGYLKQMTGKSFAVTKAPDAKLASAIFLLPATSKRVTDADRARLKGKGLEAFLLRGDATRLQIIANDMRGLAHGVYSYLERLGVRWLLAGDNWTVAPKRADITLKIDRLEAPAFWARMWAGTGGFYSNWFGRGYTGTAPREKGIADFEIVENAWMRHLRLGGQNLGHAMGEAFITSHVKILQEHPEYLAKIDGKYSPLFIPAQNGDYALDPATNTYIRAANGVTGTHELNVIAKLNAGNPAAVTLFADWILDGFRAQRKTPGGYAYQTVSVEPSDGGGEGNNYEELKAQGVGDGSESDQEFYIGNAVARRVRAEFPDTSVVMLAYYTRSDPPTFPLEPNFIVQPALGLRGGCKTADLTMDEWLTLWSKKASNMALYTYWSIPDWSHDEPTFNYLDVARQLRDWNAKNIRGINAESTWSAGAMGLGHYVAAHVMWDPKIDDKALIADWYATAFGPARAPMQRLLERWATSYRPISAEMGASYRDLAEAERLAAGNAAVTARVDDFARYLHYLRLRNEWLSAPPADKNPRASALAAYVFAINESRMVHTIRAFDLLAFRGYKFLLNEFYLHGTKQLPDDPPDGPGWARVHPLSHDDIAALIADGLKSYPPPAFAVRTYTGPLVPLKPLAWTPPAGDPWGPEVWVTADIDFDLQMLPGLAKFPLRVSRHVDFKVSITDAAGHPVYKEAFKAATGTDDEKWAANQELSVPLAPGHYTVHISPQGGRAWGYFRFQSWKGVPVILRKYISPKGQGSPKLYFYVPRGLKSIAMFFPLSNTAGGFATPVYRPDGKQATVKTFDGGKTVVVPVPAGMDGKIWWLDRFIQPDELMETLNVPQAFSLSPETLMAPKDAL